jgi:hypothetical protein
MKNLLKYLSIAVFVVGCGKSGQHAHHEEGGGSDNPNAALLSEIDEIHNEVMPKQEDIMNLKKEIQDKINAPDLSADKKKQLEGIIAELDSADRSMMDWMHKFKPKPDSVDRELAREYLENEMEKVKNLRELTNGSIQKAREELGKK